MSRRGRQSFVNSGMVQLLVASLASLQIAGGVDGRESEATGELQRESNGAIVRGDVTTKRLALVFTGGEHGESTEAILDELKRRQLKASFFLTGDYLRSAALRPLVSRMLVEGHYVGPHSDSHPLYCDWNDRDKTLVTREFFLADLEKNIADLRALGALPAGEQVYFVPPYEWYNREQAAWCKERDVQLINFTPGTGSNRDYASEGDRAFVPSQRIYDDILAFERKSTHGLNGFLLLLHLGSGRRDPFHPHLGSLCDELVMRGYELVRVDELLQ